MMAIEAHQCLELTKTFAMPISVDRNKLQVDSNLASIAKFKTPSDCGRMDGFSEELFNLCPLGDKVFAWITDWCAYPSKSNERLFACFREAHGESRSIFEAPGHVFDREFDALTLLIYISMIAFWDVWLFDIKGKFAIALNHHLSCTIISEDIGWVDECSAKLAEFLLEK